MDDYRFMKQLHTLNTVCLSPAAPLNLLQPNKPKMDRVNKYIWIICKTMKEWFKG